MPFSESRWAGLKHYAIGWKSFRSNSTAAGLARMGVRGLSINHIPLFHGIVSEKLPYSKSQV